MKSTYQPTKNTWSKVLQRPSQSITDLESIVQPIFETIAQEGDRAVTKYGKQFDKLNLNNFQVSKSEFENASTQVSDALKEAIQFASNNIRIFHEKQNFISERIETSEGVICWQERFGIENVGLYIPGGSAPLFSTVLMLGIPAILAGCKNIFLCSPPNKDGTIHPAILYTAKLIGLKNVYKIGGIQAIAAMSIGTETIAKADKIFGPGNQFVTAAKQYAQKLGTAIDMPAGPSELLIVADQSAKPSYIASDLLSQAEHGPDSQVILISKSRELIKLVEAELNSQLIQLPRADIAGLAIENSNLIYLEEEEDIIEMVNEYAPEHLILMVQDESNYLKKIYNAGSVFIGQYSPESAGDYASGTNHTLPTSGFAKSYSGLNVDAFCKYISYQKISAEGLKNLGPVIEIMAEAEGLMGHKNAVSIRLKDLKNNP